ncbi:unnamed protein product [Cyprideis torosa]|uniref:Uncharacterized protein n=1 Tax=Cyprideis torosa TaxID=163714 RepID=A0A7R8WZU0_9CRUS|nr:unnamed protein product [Cyprideis torosa]CAG0909462.1 unnamed protein product [Cyprideis torosa]
MLSILFSGFLVAFFSFCHLNLQGVSPRKGLG